MSPEIPILSLQFQMKIYTTKSISSKIFLLNNKQKVKRELIVGSMFAEKVKDVQNNN